jgi:3D (Asp-Asp-Asp) domain-containing protein
MKSNLFIAILLALDILIIGFMIASFLKANSIPPAPQEIERDYVESSQLFYYIDLGEMTITAYSSSPDECWGDPFITASGERVGEGVAACPADLPFGTKLRVGDMVLTCLDRTHDRYGDRIDIWFPSKQMALEWGIQRLKVEVIK